MVLPLPVRPDRDLPTALTLPVRPDHTLPKALSNRGPDRLVAEENLQ